MPTPPNYYGRRTLLAVAAVAVGCGICQAGQASEAAGSGLASANVQGRVESKQAGACVSGLRVVLQRVPKDPGGANSVDRMEAVTRTDADGRFRFDRLHEGSVSIYVDGCSAPWTCLAASNIELKSGWTRAVRLELVHGVEVTGQVLRRTGEPYEGADVGMYGAARPRHGVTPLVARTDDRGRYRFLVPPGEASFHVMTEPEGKASRAVIVPDGADRLEILPIVAGPILLVGGRVIGPTGAAVEGATVRPLRARGGLLGGFDVVTDARGEFQLPPALDGGVPFGLPAGFRICLRDGKELVESAVPADDGTVLLVADPARGAAIPGGILRAPARGFTGR